MILTSTATAAEIGRRLGRSAPTILCRRELLLNRRAAAQVARRKGQAAARFQRPHWFEEPPPETMAAPRPGYAVGAIVNAGRR
jgi:hypothetical protein